jgi:hypothetical protein
MALGKMSLPRHLSACTGVSLTGPTASPTLETRPATVESPLTEIRSDVDLQVNYYTCRRSNAEADQVGQMPK